MGKLTSKQELFCKEYLIDLNATQSALRAGYSAKTAGSVGHENLKKPEIAEKIQILFGERADRVELNSDWVLNRLKEIDSLDVLDIVNDDLSGFKLLSQWPKEWRTSISSLDMKKMVTSIGENEELETIIEKIKWPDKVKNLEMIGRHVKVKAWDKEEQKTTITNNIMPVPTADSIDSWEEQAKKQQDKILNKHE